MNYEDRVTKEYVENAIANAGPRFQTGTYVGTGTYGKENPMSLHFDFEPMVVFLYNYAGDRQAMPFWPGTSYNRMIGVSSDYLYVTFSGADLSWYAYNVTLHFNEGNMKYYWLAIG